MEYVFPTRKLGKKYYKVSSAAAVFTLETHIPTFKTPKNP